MLYIREKFKEKGTWRGKIASYRGHARYDRKED